MFKYDKYHYSNTFMDVITWQVFVMVKATNGAGLSTVSASNGIYISYLSQGLEPFSVIGIWDTDPILIGDMWVNKMYFSGYEILYCTCVNKVTFIKITQNL